VTPTPAVQRTFTDRIEVLGVAKGRESVTITSNTLELVTQVHFQGRTTVRKGEPLVDLQSSEQDANVLVAQVALDQAKRQYDRWKELTNRGVAPVATFEQYEATYKQAEANLTAAQSRRANRTIRAPFSGVVGLTDVAPGSLINPGTPIVTLDDISTVRVDFDVPDRYLPLVENGAQITAQSDVVPGLQVRGKIARLDSRINDRTRAIKARAEFPNGDGKLKPGMLMRINIEQGQRQAVAVPESAVQFESDQATVFVLIDQDGQTVAQRRTVKAGSNDSGFIEIKEGLKPGERVVRDGLSNVQAGPVRLVEMAASGSARPAGASAPAAGGDPR
jgi:membrane fusion protein (multidrug efflux system)